jgi:hypothetical protein
MKPVITPDLQDWSDGLFNDAGAGLNFWPDAADDGGVAGAASSLDPGASRTAPATLAYLENPAGRSSDAVTQASIGSGGATGAQVQQALDESGLSVNGANIRVGVLSDSFNDLGGAAADEASGALPSAANIDVIKDLASGGTDEGRAMMQIIHDIAPGASLAFYTAENSEQDFANGILSLAAAGCKVIVDDVSYYDEPFFQNGVVAQAIETVEAEGVTYVTAAGNEGGNGYQAAWTPISGTFGGKKLTDAESFGGSLVQTISINTEGTGDGVPLLLEWNQAYGAATSDLEMLVFNSSGRLIGTATNALDGEPTNPWLGYDFTKTGTYFVAIENLSGPDPGLIKEITEGDGLPATISGANTGTVFGHAMTPGAITAGAVSAAETPGFGVNLPLSESFSSSGAGTELLFADNGSALSSPDDLNPVAVSGVDDISTTVSGGLSDFYGTSAASASLASVAALILSADPNLTPAQVEQIMEQTALPMSNPAVSGAGLVQVNPAVSDAIRDLHGVTNDFAAGGVSDVLLSNSSGAAIDWILQNGSYQSQKFVGNAAGYSIVGTGDFNGNGTADILLQNSGGAIIDWMMSNGTYAGYDPVGAAPGYSVAGTGDFTGDGTSDVLLENGSGALIDWIMQNGTYSSYDPIGNTSGYGVIGTGDFNGDGTDDVLLQNGGGSIIDWTMRNGVYSGYNNVGNPGASGYDVVGTGDFNGDGTSDILLESNSGSLIDWTMQNGKYAGWNGIGNTSGYSVVGTGDYNGDGTADVLLQNAVGNVIDWIVKNGQFSGWNEVGAAGSYTVVNK